MKCFTYVLMLSLLLWACGGQAPGGDALDTTRMERPDSESIASIAQVMSKDLARFLHEDDIQSAAALCQEALDNIMYFKNTEDYVSADIYATSLHKFVKNHYDDMEDMATQNYIIKQFMVAVGDTAIVNAQRRRYPQEENVHKEPNVEDDKQTTSRPTVKRWRQKSKEDEGVKKKPIIVECKTDRTSKTRKSNGEATSSQWYLVLPLD